MTGIISHGSIELVPLINKMVFATRLLAPGGFGDDGIFRSAVKAVGTVLLPCEEPVLLAMTRR